jgi:hypothetical protein
MARKTTILERIEPSDATLLGMSKEALLLHSDRRAAADELYRRAFNKLVKSQAA